MFKNKKRYFAVIAFAAVLTGCSDPVPQYAPQAVQQAPVVVQQSGGATAGETALAAGGGALAGSLLGNALSNRNNHSQPQYQSNTRPVIVQRNVTIINRSPAAVKSNTFFSRPATVSRTSTVSRPTSSKTWMKGYRK